MNSISNSSIWLELDMKETHLQVNVDPKCHLKFKQMPKITRTHIATSEVLQEVQLKLVLWELRCMSYFRDKRIGEYRQYIDYYAIYK